ncbi:MAG: L,D-transpeptidase [Desulfomonilaceae bacterium]
MSVLSRTGVLLVIAGVLACAPWGWTSQASAKDSIVKELLLSLAYPPEAQQPEPTAYADIEKLLSEPLEGVEDRSDVSSPVAWKFPFREDHLRKQKESAEKVSEAFLPGARSLGSMPERWTRLASLHPIVPAARRLGATILDSGERFSSAGRLVGDPVSLFSSFEVQVSKSNYTLKLYGIKNGGDRTLLFECRTGLGSPEFPTPRGSYYLVRIFDDHPIWIPPPGRDWAYGQAPSRSAYGGHMMPLFRKSPIKGDGKVNEPVTTLDSIAPSMNLADTGTYRVHGTDSPWSIGSSQSHGCVRLLNKDAKRLSDTLKMYVGTTTRDESPNGPYINLARTVRLVLH